MIINTHISGQTSNKIELSSNQTVHIVPGNATEVILQYSYSHLDGLTGYISLFDSSGIVSSAANELVSGETDIFDVLQLLSNSGVYNFDMVAYDRNGQTDKIQYTVVYDYPFDDFTFGYDSNTDAYYISAYLGSSSSVEIPPFYNDGTNGLLAVTKIAAGVFFDNNVIENITVPYTITEIGNNAFFSCLNLSSVTVNAETPPVLGGEDVFDPNGELSLLKIYVPSGSVSAYQSAQYWSNYSNDIISQ